MTLLLDPETGKITYNGEVVGDCSTKDGKSIVRINLEYETEGEGVVPLSWLAYGLALLPENQPPPTLLTIETPEDSIDEEFDVPRFLTEKKVKRSGYVWKFHKTDVDNWPSPLHGHDYDKGLKLDVLTGNIYDVGTKKLCKTLKAKHLDGILADLRASDDFKEVVKKLLS